VTRTSVSPTAAAAGTVTRIARSPHATTVPRAIGSSSPKVTEPGGKVVQVPSPAARPSPQKSSP
jgi:hypothetical protein